MPEARIPLSSRKKAMHPSGEAGTSLRSANRAVAQHDAAVLQQYQNAVQLMQQAKFDKALIAFEKLSTSAPPPLAERCRMYLAACHRELKKTQLSFATAEEQFDYAVSLLNMDYYEEARDHFNAILRKNPAADFALYGIAVLDSITGQIEDCLEHLGQAIQLNPRNRLQARTDTDFQTMQDDPRFTELLYPEAP